MHAAALTLILALTHGGIPPVGPANSPHPKLVTRHHHRLHRIVYYSPLKGSHESLLRQNMKVDEDDLQRIEDDTQLAELIQKQQLLGLPESKQVTIDPTLPEARRYCRPWTRAFLQEFGNNYFAEFHQPLQVNSAVRTIAFQKKLRRHNHNAADLDGDTASPHLTGASVDLAKHGMTRKQLKWMRENLLAMQQNGDIDVEEEFRQRVFHITVYKSFELSRAEQPPAEKSE